MKIYKNAILSKSNVYLIVVIMMWCSEMIYGVKDDEHVFSSCSTSKCWRTSQIPPSYDSHLKIYGDTNSQPSSSSSSPTIPKSTTSPTTTSSPSSVSSSNLPPRQGYPYYMTIGIATIRRAMNDDDDSLDQSTLIKTLSSLFSHLQENDEKLIRIFVFNLQNPPEKHEQFYKAQSIFASYVHDNIISFVVPSADDSLTELLNEDKVEITHGDAIDRVLWRSKENLDFCFIYSFCARFAPYVLFMEDDVLASNKFVPRILDHLSKPPLISNPNHWKYFSLYTPNRVEDRRPVSSFACCTQSVVLQSKDADEITTYIKQRYAKDPIDWLFNKYLNYSNSVMYYALPSVFQHDTTISTLYSKKKVPFHVAYMFDSNYDFEIGR
eukprot:TRINITY_DN1980_c1_g1_i1.p1 TRINITY_DN1980_c1_g1~~TRINITY_DN1980_c1_g1_i1.p1  ORF type:complete len:380 (-),score=93.67 TRINITY_DN1980_c1_g1_i1:61-1200(-)